jgi:hypothetical protein
MHLLTFILRFEGQAAHTIERLLRTNLFLQGIGQTVQRSAFGEREEKVNKAIAAIFVRRLFRNRTRRPEQFGLFH